MFFSGPSRPTYPTARVSSDSPSRSRAWRRADPVGSVNMGSTQFAQRRSLSGAMPNSSVAICDNRPDTTIVRWTQAFMTAPY